MSALLIVNIPHLIEAIEGKENITLEEVIVLAYELSTQEHISFSDQLKIRTALNTIGYD